MLEQSAPSKILQQYSSRLQQVQQAIQAQQKTRMNDKNMQFQHAAALAASLDPYRVLARGYALVTDTKGKVCTVEQLQPEQPICVRSRQYQARCRVERWRRSMRAPKSFEEGMDRLNTILAQMQQEDTSLADSVKLYAEAAP